MDSDNKVEPRIYSGVDHEQFFDPGLYLRQYYSTPDGDPDEGDFAINTANFWARIFSQGKIKGQSLLDIGSGPNIYSLIPASQVFSEMYMSDYCATNREYAQRWLDRVQGVHDFSAFFKFAAEKEGISQWEDVERRTRAAINGIYNCDVMNENPIEPADFQQFDCITSSLCLEAAVHTSADFILAMKNIVKLLKPSGHLIMIGVLNESFYLVGECRFHCFKVTRQLLEEAVTEAGCHQVSLKVLPFSGTVDSSTNPSDFQGYFHLHAVKDSDLT